MWQAQHHKRILSLKCHPCVGLDSSPCQLLVPARRVVYGRVEKLYHVANQPDSSKTTRFKAKAGMFINSTDLTFSSKPGAKSGNQHVSSSGDDHRRKRDDTAE